MKTSTVPTVLLTLAVLLTGRAVGQTPFTFAIDSTASSFSWSGSTNQGPLTGASQSFDLKGDLNLEISSDVQGIHTGRFTGAEAAIQPGIFGEFNGVASNPFEITGARLTFVSDTFAVAPDGSFTARLTPSFLDGEMMISPPLGPLSFILLEGMTLEQVMVHGTLTPSGSALRLVVPVVLVFEFTGAAVNGTLTMSGKLAADLGCPARSYCVTSPNSVGPGALILTSGSQSVGANNFLLSSLGSPPQVFGLFFYAQLQGQQPAGDGTLCLSAPFFRLPASKTDAMGRATLLLDLTDLPGAGQILAGSTWNFQWWYRDVAAGGAGFNLSDGVQVFFCP